MAVLLSGGEVVSTSGPYSTPFEWSGPGGNAGHPMLDFFRSCQYEELYECQPSVNKVIDKRARLQGLVPFNALRRTPDGPMEAPDSPHGRLVAKPCAEMSQFEWRDWHFHVKDIQGITFGILLRDDPDRPSGGVLEVPAVHPMRMRYGPNEGKASEFRAGRLTAHERVSGKSWWYVVDESREVHVPRRDLFIWKNFHPRNRHWGLSKLDPLRSTLEDDAAARCAMESMWKRGARPHYVITSPDAMEDHPAVIQQVREDAQEAHGGVGNWWAPLVLDGGMDITELRTEDGLEYLSLRKLTDLDVGAVFDLSGPVIHQLERATFNNIYEIFREVFKSSLGYDLRSFEAAWENDVRDGRHGEPVAPNFPAQMSAKFNVMGVLRGSPEQQIESYSTQLQTGMLTVNEQRAMEGRPPVEGGDVALVNAALVPLSEAGQRDLNDDGAVGGEPVDDEPDAGPSALRGLRPIGLPASTGKTGRDAAQAVLGRLGRVDVVESVDVDRLVDGLSAEAARKVRYAVAVAVIENESVEALRDLIRGTEL